MQVEQASPSPAAPAPDALVQQGIEVYHRQYCGICHRLDAAQTTGTFGPDHNHLGATAEQRLADPTYQGSAATAAEYIRESILDPEIYLVPGYEQSRHKMPAFTFLSEPDVAALVALLLQQK